MRESRAASSDTLDMEITTMAQAKKPAKAAKPAKSPKKQPAAKAKAAPAKKGK
jgi:hypothetical protein